ARTVRAVERTGRERSLAYDKLVLATGSQLVRPDLPGAQHIFDIDTLPSAAALDHHLRRLPRHAASPGRYTAVVVGAGFTGVEIATGLGERLRAIADSQGTGEEVRV
ncbi:FAD-dependent oxidoreductase, partial [Streptomyces sp. NRRL F-6674]